MAAFSNVETESFYISAAPSRNNSSSTATVLNVTIHATIKFRSSDPRRPGREVELQNLSSLSLDMLADSGDDARDTMASMLSEMHLPHDAVSPILKYCRFLRISNNRTRSPRFRVWNMDVFIGAIADEPAALFSDDDDDDDNDDPERISFDEYTIRFVPASKESIEGLEKVRINQEVISCSVCCEDVLVGSEATRLPCSHLFHGDCIVQWLQKSKYCPLCRFELPS